MIILLINILVRHPILFPAAQYVSTDPGSQASITRPCGCVTLSPATMMYSVSSDEIAVVVSLLVLPRRRTMSGQSLAQTAAWRLPGSVKYYMSPLGRFKATTSLFSPVEKQSQITSNLCQMVATATNEFSIVNNMYAPVQVQLHVIADPKHTI